MSVRDDDPVVPFGDVLFQPLIDGRFAFPADQLPDIRPVLQDAPDGGGTPALALDVIPGACPDPALAPLRAFNALRLELVYDPVEGHALELPLEDPPDNGGSFLVHHIGGLILIPEVAVGKVAVAEGPGLHLRPERRGDLFGNIPRVYGVHQEIGRASCRERV